MTVLPEQNEQVLEQGEFAGIFCARPQNFAWFPGTGASASAGLPRGTDILCDLKRQLYCRQENQEITRQDMQSEPVRSRIQAYVESKGFPALWAADDEYGACFERLFGDDRERRRRYLKVKLADDNAKLTAGSRALGGMIAAGMCRAALTTNFDGLVERSTAEVAGPSLMAFHLEGSRAANQALMNEEYPIYCKLHGDFRYLCFCQLLFCDDADVVGGCCSGSGESRACFLGPQVGWRCRPS